MHATPILALLALGAAAVAPPREPRPSASHPVFSDPLAITHPLFSFPAPGTPGARLMGNDQAGTYEASVFSTETRTIEWKGQRIDCRVVCETEIEDGDEVESSETYFAQSDDGSVFTFGDTITYQEPGSVEKSWIVGSGLQQQDVVVVANPFLFLPAEIAPGETWTSEDVPGVSTEVKTLLSEGVTFATSNRQYQDCSVIGSLSDGYELHVLVHAPGVGLVHDSTRESWQELLAVR